MKLTGAWAPTAVVLGALVTWCIAAAQPSGKGYVDKILRGAKPGDLAVEQPTRLELVLNLRTAKALGLTLSPALRLRADHIIE